jgi:hypothetical protein
MYYINRSSILLQVEVYRVLSSCRCQQLLLIVVQPILILLQIINKLSVLFIQFLKLMQHRMSVVFVFGNQNMTNALLSIFYVVASLGVENVWDAVELLVVDDRAALKRFLPIFEVVVKQHCRSLIVQINLIYNFGGNMCCYSLHNSKKTKNWN